MKNLTKVLTILLVFSVKSFPYGTFHGRRTNMTPDHHGPGVLRTIHRIPLFSPFHRHGDYHHVIPHRHQQQLHRRRRRHQRQKRMQNGKTEDAKRTGAILPYQVSQSVFMENIVPLDQQTAPYDLFSSQDGYYRLIQDAINSTNTTGHDPRPSNSSEQMPLLPMYYPVSFKVVGSFFVGLIFLTGVLGNVMVVLVVVKMRSMHTPTNCYLMSLAVADLLLLIFACLPTLVEFYTVQDHFLFGWLGCKLMVFAQYLSVNLSSLSMTAFTVERYVAICHPMIAHRMCTVRRANKIIVCLWLFGLLYCSPWVVLISVKPLTFDDSTVIDTCTFNLKRSHYATYYVADLLVFYVVPLIVNSVLYVCIGKTLYHAPGSGKVRRAVAKQEENTMVEMVTTSNGGGMRADASKVRNEEKLWTKHGQQHQQQHQHQQQQQQQKQQHHYHHHDHGIKITTMDGRNRIQVIKMLAVVVAMFAILWLPYRGYVVYNSFAKVRFECSWCMLACRLMIYMNSAINPVLYNAMSSKFRRSFLRLLFFGGRRHHDQNLQMKHVNSTND